MKIPRMANAVGHIDDDLVTAATESKKKTKHTHWLKWDYLAACFAVLVVVGAAILPSLLGEDNVTGGRYKDFYIQADESEIVWPWDCKTECEKYTNVEINGADYIGKGRAVSESLVGESIGNYTVVGYDEINNGKKYTAEFEVYKLKDIAQSQFVAVKMGDNYYVFQSDEYAPPSTLGKLMDQVDLSKVVEFNRFSENGDSPSNSHFVLTDDDYIWKVLADCEGADFVEDQSWIVSDRNHLSFTISSEIFGIYKAALYVTEDGYLWTNAFSYQYLFNIGEDAAGKIIKYAKENSTEAEYEPYRNSIAGTIVEITDEYILVDDSVLCHDPADGITYKVMLDDLRISRYVDHGVVETGDTVQIFYEGEINKTNTITDAISASKTRISGEDVLIPE